MEDNPISREEYVRNVLVAYCKTPGTTGCCRRADLLLATHLFEQGVPLIAVENAFLLAAARRLFSSSNDTLLYDSLPCLLLPVIHEVLDSHLSQEYFLYLRLKLQPFVQTAPAHSTHNGR